ncbi:Ldh family oxidoreductase [Catenovulum sediminis]|uniref:Ldh family oxidoreductase n=1 Tax=Catenovulum sediminis TaxID=1740262 RepID=A0ABV1RNT6_9ALTE|nr:Ldh family oxidoreductase [Catenovulum sediminis]
MTDIVRFQYEQLLDKLAKALTNLGVPEAMAYQEVAIMLDADKCEVPSHGIRMFPKLVQAISDGLVAPDIEPTEMKTNNAMTVIDYHNGLGRYSSQHAMTRAQVNARKFGIGACIAINTTHWGRAHYYVREAANNGFLGFCTTNAVPSMTLQDCKFAVLGNNPIGIGAPTGDGTAPLVLDMALSQSSVGKIATASRHNRKVEYGLGVNRCGELSDDPDEILDGAVIPMGGYKGESLAIMTECLTSILAGSDNSLELKDDNAPSVDSRSSKLFIALNINASTSLEAYYGKANKFIHSLKKTSVNYRSPGERSWHAAKNNSISIPVHNDIVAELKKFGVV